MELPCRFICATRSRFSTFGDILMWIIRRHTSLIASHPNKGSKFKWKISEIISYISSGLFLGSSFLTLWKQHAFFLTITSFIYCVWVVCEIQGPGFGCQILMLQLSLAPQELLFCELNVRSPLGCCFCSCVRADCGLDVADNDGNDGYGVMLMAFCHRLHLSIAAVRMRVFPTVQVYILHCSQAHKGGHHCDHRGIQKQTPAHDAKYHWRL